MPSKEHFDAARQWLAARFACYEQDLQSLAALLERRERKAIEEAILERHEDTERLEWFFGPDDKQWRADIDAARKREQDAGS